MLLGMRIIPNNKVGIVEKLWSGAGSLPEGSVDVVSVATPRTVRPNQGRWSRV